MVSAIDSLYLRVKSTAICGDFNINVLDIYIVPTNMVGDKSTCAGNCHSRHMLGALNYFPFRAPSREDSFISCYLIDHEPITIYDKMQGVAGISQSIFRPGAI